MLFTANGKNFILFPIISQLYWNTIKDLDVNIFHLRKAFPLIKYLGNFILRNIWLIIIKHILRSIIAPGGKDAQIYAKRARPRKLAKFPR